MQQGPFAPRALPRFNATTDPAATVSSSTVFPGPPVMRSTLLRRFLDGTRTASPVAWHVLVTGCLRCLLLVMCTHPFAKEALTLHLPRSEGRERYFGCNLMHCKALASSHQHLMAEAPGSRGDSYDNALAESIIGLYKTEVIHRRGPWRGLEDVEFATLEWVHWYNTQRLLEPIGNVAPVEYEMNYYRSQEGSLEMARLN